MNSNVIYEMIRKCILDYMNEYRVDKYLGLMRMARDGNISKEFKSLFISYYAIRKNSDWLERYFEILVECLRKQKCPDFAELLEELKDSSISNKIRYEASYASKLIATIDCSKPIYDKWVRYALMIGDFDAKYSTQKNTKIMIYNRIEYFYQSTYYKEFRNRCIDIFNELVEESDKISDVKKIDFTLWSMGKAGVFVPAEMQ